MRWSKLLATVTVSVFLLLSSSPAVASSRDLALIPAGENLYGKLSAAWWQWALAIPVAHNPLFDPDGDDCAVGQAGNVWFLAGNSTAAPSVTRQCTVPASKRVFFPLINVECSNVEPVDGGFYGKTPGDRVACARAFMDTVGLATLQLTLDDHAVAHPERLRAASGDFGFTIPSDNMLGVSIPPSTGRSAADGFYALLAPPSRGHHVITFHAEVTSGPFAGYTQDVTYQLTVR